MTKTNLLDYSLPELQALMCSMDEKSYRGLQIYQWLHSQESDDLDSISSLSKSLRLRLVENFCCELPQLVSEHIATDGTIKWVLGLGDGNEIETVFIPEANRGTLCISSQAGCAAKCGFCHTGVGGFNTDLSTAKIIGQLIFAKRRLIALSSKEQITNVVMMGMGEPLLNFHNVVKATNIMLDDHAHGLSKHRVTISTIGIIPRLLELSKLSQAALTVSLHATTDEMRTKIMPMNKKYPLAELLEVCRNYFPAASKRKITFAYIMLNGVNDTPADAKRLAKLVAGIPCKINLIPFNSFTGAIFTSSTKETIANFSSILRAKGLITTVRKTRGDGVAGACGQLVGQVMKRKQVPQKTIRSL